jgi:hypothetical protein
MIPPMPASWSRRSVLGLIGAGATTALVGCAGEKGRGPDDLAGPTQTPQPRTPTEVADVPALLAALARARELRTRTTAIQGARGGVEKILAEATTAHAEQADVLERLLLAGAVEIPAAPTAPLPATPTSPTSSSAPPADDARATSVSPQDQGRARVEEAERAAEQAAREARALSEAAAQDLSASALSELAQVSGANLAMLTAVTGQRGALAELGTELNWQPLEGPTGAAAAGVLAAFRQAVYAFEVIAGKASGEEQDQFEPTLSQLRNLTRQLTALAADAAPPAPLGYGLPDLGTPQLRRSLAGDVFAALPPSVVSGAGAHTDDLASVTGTVRLLTESLVLGRRWGLTLQGFPGMTVP